MITPIAAIDLIGGQVVRLRQGDFTQQTTYSSDPLRVALELEKMGFRRLHLVDLDGARAGKVRQLAVLRELATHTALQIDFGGGVQTEADIDSILEAGACQVTIGSLAVRQPEKLTGFLRTFGADTFLLAADVREGFLVTGAWTEQSRTTPVEFLDFWQENGIREVFLTEVSRDGLLNGPATDFYQTLCQAFPQLQLLASGGVRGPGDVLALEIVGCAGVIIGKALYEPAVPREQWTTFLQRYPYAG